MKATPQRIQRRRTKGWKMPEGAISVTRPGKWGNFLKLSGDMIMIDAGYRRTNLDRWVFLCFGNLERMLEIYRAFFNPRYINMPFFGIDKEMKSDLEHWLNVVGELDLNEILDKDLACFCPIGSHCHADVLLELTNK